MRRLVWILALVSLLAVAGCLGGTDDEIDAADAAGGDEAEDGGHAMTFAEPRIIDDKRAGGEPVIAMTNQGTLIVSAHPGWTHVHPTEDEDNPPTELLTPTSGESYIWRSTDEGDTWNHVGLATPGEESGPRGAAVGVSDPDLTVREDNSIFYTDLYLFEASVGWSSDDGKTWVTGNPAASQGIVDRQWLASSGQEVYFTSNYFSPPGRPVLATEDGVVWERRGEIPEDCGGDFVASPHDGTLYAGCGTGIAVSEDGADTWEQRMVPDASDASGFYMTEPAVDGAGNVWIAWEENESELVVAGSPDKGESWPWIHDLAPDVEHSLEAEDELTMVWPWVSAGSEGRVSVSVYATPSEPPSDSGPSERSWSVVSVALLDGAGEVHGNSHGYVLAEDVHRGPICQSGTACQVNSLQGDENSDRRLGDFFETTIGHDGRLYVAYADTTSYPDDVISHPGFVKQTGGPSFLAEGSDYMPTQG